MKPILFALEAHPLSTVLCAKLGAVVGLHSYRRFPDGESYLRIETPVAGQHCLVLANLSHPDEKFLPLAFLTATLRELGAASVGLIAPYLSYMRQDRRFVDGEAVTSRIFAKQISQMVDWLVTVDPHLHRYHSLDEIYSIPTRVVHATPMLAAWLSTQTNAVLIGPDAESEQWVSAIAAQSGHPFAVGNKQRHGDRDVVVSLPDLTKYVGHTAIIIDDVISSGQTLLRCVQALKSQQFRQIECIAVHGLFADAIDQLLMAQGVRRLITTNSIPHSSNALDLSDLLQAPIEASLALLKKPKD